MLNGILDSEFKTHYGITEQCEQESRLMDREQICLLLHSLIKRIELLENSLLVLSNKQKQNPSITEDSNKSLQTIREHLGLTISSKNISEYL